MTDTPTTTRLFIDLPDRIVAAARRRDELPVTDQILVLTAVRNAADAMPRPVTMDDPPPWGAHIYDDDDHIGHYVGPDPTARDNDIFVAVAREGTPAIFLGFDSGYTWRPAS